MKKTVITRSLLILSALVLGCDKTADLLDDTYIPDFSNEWSVVRGNATGFFFLGVTSVDSAKGTGLLTGEDESTDNLDVVGNFTNLKVNLTISADSVNPGNAPLADSSYSGKIDTFYKPNLMRLANLASPHDSLILIHQ
jgi:hypothetical protein